MRRIVCVSVLSVTCVVGASCIVQAPTAETTPQTTQRLPPAPPVEMKSGANFGDFTELQSVIVSPGRASPGDSVKVLMNFKVLKDFEADYMIFVHVEDVDGRVDRINVDHAPVRGGLPTTKWKAGEMVRDEFDIPIPPTYPVRGLNVIMGFWDPKTDARLKVLNADKVRTDGRDRVFVAQFPVVAQ